MSSYKPFKNKTTNNINRGIHNGAVTHHQDQAITSHNFKTKNTMNSANKSILTFISESPFRDELAKLVSLQPVVTNHIFTIKRASQFVIYTCLNDVLP